ncbi:hypothetical protein BDQ12DRAFT_728086 [Crucibulum laeve]|uniref:Uncharacterized protein n=1 Tax=Crucibulum laeve TaxID=68775 RepID=A0A5C3LL86_9AGAR|nr:hypothetical protein BDQ12DRAFT_728086 [Crucibulum laeve]
MLLDAFRTTLAVRISFPQVSFRVQSPVGLVNGVHFDSPTNTNGTSRSTLKAFGSTFGGARIHQEGKHLAAAQIGEDESTACRKDADVGSSTSEKRSRSDVEDKDDSWTSTTLKRRRLLTGVVSRRLGRETDRRSAMDDVSRLSAVESTDIVYEAGIDDSVSSIDALTAKKFTHSTIPSFTIRHTNRWANYYEREVPVTDKGTVLSNQMEPTTVTKEFERMKTGLIAAQADLQNAEIQGRFTTKYPRNELRRENTEFRRAKAHLETTETEFETMKTKLAETEKALKKTRIELEMAKIELERKDMNLCLRDCEVNDKTTELRRVTKIFCNVISERNDLKRRLAESKKQLVKVQADASGVDALRDDFQAMSSQRDSLIEEKEAHFCRMMNYHRILKREQFMKKTTTENVVQEDAEHHGKNIRQNEAQACPVRDANHLFTISNSEAASREPGLTLSLIELEKIKRDLHKIENQIKGAITRECLHMDSISNSELEGVKARLKQWQDRLHQVRAALRGLNPGIARIAVQPPMALDITTQQSRDMETKLQEALRRCDTLDEELTASNSRLVDATACANELNRRLVEDGSRIQVQPTIRKSSNLSVSSYEGQGVEAEINRLFNGHFHLYVKTTLIHGNVARLLRDAVKIEDNEKHQENAGGGLVDGNINLRSCLMDIQRDIGDLVLSYNITEDGDEFRKRVKKISDGEWK